jgi:transposase-like protein
VEIISHCVWLYHRFPLSFRKVDEMMLARGVVVSHETIRQWCQKFGQTYANGLRRRRPRLGDKWHLDEMFITINGNHYLWRVVDQDGVVLDILAQCRRNAAVAKKFFRRLLKELRYVSRVVVSDKLRSYGAAHRVVPPSVEHRSSKDLNNRAENSHQPTRQRERAMKRFTLPRTRAAVPVRVQRDITALSSLPPSAQRRCLPPTHDRTLRHLNEVVGLPTDS